MTEHRFGGDWTQDKLERVSKYLPAYTLIFNRNQDARYYQTVYVDGFAGTGYIAPRDESIPGASLFSEFSQPDSEAQRFLKGSAQIALETLDKEGVFPFDHYIFIEKEAAYAAQLQQLRMLHYEDRGRIEIVNQDTNKYLTTWCATQNWKKQRAVVFLDPYSLEVEWDTLVALAATKAVDLWLLWPIGQAVNRLLTKRKLPPLSWQRALDRAFGTEDWRSFYEVSAQQSLGLEESGEVNSEKVVGFKEIEQFFIRRLQTIFAHVAPNPLYLRNSQNTPLYLLCFAAHNPKAVKIAQDILSK